MGQRDLATIETLDGAVARLAVRRGSWLVGRGPDAHLRLYSDHVGTHHAWIRCDARGTWVSDAGSRTGTLVNGEALAPERPGCSGTSKAGPRSSTAWFSSCWASW
jgi:pSer/pThr/pTyr-binding forkhead associated (FHA) protein